MRAIAFCTLLTATPVFAQGPARGAESTWHDATHWVGIAGGGLALLAALVGLVVLAGLFGRAYEAPWRQLARGKHVLLGMAAITLGLTHFGLRWWQGEIHHVNGPVILGIAMLLLLASGYLRAFAPPAWQRKQWKVYVWSHRALVVIVLIMLLMHAYGEYQANA